MEAFMKNGFSLKQVIVSMLISIVALALLFEPAFSQSFKGTILGTVKDETGAVLAGATVTITNVNTGLTRTILTNDSGDYLVPLLPPGEYQVSAELAGFKKEVISGIVLQVEQKARVDITLAVGEISEVVNVIGSAPLTQTDTAAVGSVIDNKKVVELPLNGRLFFQLNLLLPGAAPGVFGSQLSTQGGSIVVNGAREAQNNFLLDGIDNNDLAINLFTIPPSIDAIHEFKLQSSTYTAEFGRSGGAQINITTKSGTNEIHGTAFEFLRNDALDARNFFDPTRQSQRARGRPEIPEFKRNQFGWSIGGPVIRDRTFFFFNFEGTRIRKAITQTAAVPTPAMKRGDFSAAGVTIRDPLTGQLFPNNTIPPDKISPIGAKIAAFYPDPNLAGPGRNFVSSPPLRRTVNQFTVRIDHKLGQSDDFFARYTFNDDDRFDTFEAFIRPISGTEVPGFGAFTLNRMQSLAVSETHIFSPRLINEFRFGYNLFTGGIFQENIGKDITGELGIPGTSRNPLDFGFPCVVVAGFSNLCEATNLPQNRHDHTFQFFDSVSYTVGRHALKFGVDIRRFQINLLFDTNARGLFVFTGEMTGNALADLLLGLPRRTSINIPDGGLLANSITYQRTLNSSFYVQDDWKVTPNLTLNLGLRYELNTPVTEKFDRFSKFDLGRRRIIRADEPDVPRKLYNTDINNFAPRIGLAWRPFGNNRTVIRSGYGVYYDTKLLNIQVALGLGAPFRTTFDFFSDPRNPTLTLANPFPSGAGRSPIPSPVFIPDDFPDGYMQQWSLTIQRELASSLVVEAGYVGSKGTKLDRIGNINQPRPGPGSIQDRRPFQGFGNIFSREAEASSTYHSFQLRAEKRYSAGLMFIGSYTVSKAIDNGSRWNIGAQDFQNLKAEKGLADFDVRQRFSYSFTYDLPLGSGKRYLSGAAGPFGKLISGWQLGGIVTFQSGQPISAIIARDQANVGTAGQRPNLIGNPNLPSNQRSPDRWFNTAAFVLPAPFTFGNAGRDIIIGPGVNNIDFSLLKNTYITEDKYIQLRAEFFNLFNHPNFNPPATVADAPATFGKIFSAADSRQIQFGLKLIF